MNHIVSPYHRGTIKAPTHGLSSDVFQEISQEDRQVCELDTGALLATLNGPESSVHAVAIMSDNGRSVGGPVESGRNVGYSTRVDGVLL